MEDLEKIYEKLNTIQQTFGLGMVLFIIVIGIGFFFYWKYLLKAVELKAQEGLEKELTKFKTKHGNQIDAIHECYNKFERLSSFVNYMLHGDKYIAPIEIDKQLQRLLQLRQEFKDKFEENRIIFPKKTCKKVDELIPVIDEFFETFQGGIFHQSQEDIERNAKLNQGVYIAGIWSANAFTDILKKLEEVKKDIEDEFREIYGTK